VPFLEEYQAKLHLYAMYNKAHYVSWCAFDSFDTLKLILHVLIKTSETNRVE